VNTNDKVFTEHLQANETETPLLNEAMGYVDEGASSIEVWILTISSYYINVTARSIL
jgi:hypothetical protein